MTFSRRDFLNGVALGTAAGAMLSPAELAAATGTAVPAYPPMLTGMRGAHPGSFEIAHAVAWSGQTFTAPAAPDEDDYDLVVVGGGISGLAAALFYRQRSGPDARVLVLDNHDDFGGHAKRNEFVVDGQRLIGYGGSQSIDTPGQYSAASKQLLEDVGIDVQRFYRYYDTNFDQTHGLRRGIYFSSDRYGRDLTAANAFPGFFGGVPEDVAALVGRYPLADADRAALLRLLTTDADPLVDLAPQARVDHLRATSYSDYLRREMGMPESVVALARNIPLGLWGVGWDALSTLEAIRLGMPGIGAVDPALADVGGYDDEPYIFHFPDGNAGVARAIVRRLLPDAVPGSTMEDLVTSVADYARLDRDGSRTRIRLDSTAVEVRHVDGDRRVDVTYVRDGQVRKARGRHVVLACYNAMIPHLCPELPAAQRAAMAYAEKVPLVYMSLAVRNWRPFAELGYGSFYVPQPKYLHAFGLDFPVSMGDYAFAASPDQPTLLHGSWVPAAPDRGLTAREQHAIGRRALYELDFAAFEEDIVAKLDGALGTAGFDVERDLAAITVNRWPHGYAYEYNDYSDPAGWGPDNGPHVTGRAQIGRISIANSDAAGYAYVNGAVDAAHRAVNEQLKMA
ncbi:MAG: FAD-dependent oxidoreductase [Pseudomonadales bacterium]